MIVESVYFIRQWGAAATVTLDDELGPQRGDILQRSDGKSWVILAVEWFTLPRSATRPERGDKVGLLLSDEDWDVAVGDVVSVLRSKG